MDSHEQYEIEQAARALAKRFIRPYVERGDSFESLKKSHMGMGCTGERVQIGGWMNDKSWSTDFILVSKVGGRRRTSRSGSGTFSRKSGARFSPPAMSMTSVWSRGDRRAPLAPPPLYRDRIAGLFLFLWGVRGTRKPGAGKTPRAVCPSGGPVRFEI